MAHSPCTPHIAGIGNSSAVTLPSVLACCSSSILRSTVHTSTPQPSQPPFNRIVRSSSHTATQTALTAQSHFNENYPTGIPRPSQTNTHTRMSPNDTHNKQELLIPSEATGRTPTAHEATQTCRDYMQPRPGNLCFLHVLGNCTPVKHVFQAACICSFGCSCCRTMHIC
ncbi:unnamed protein product [Trypanosoma congolense IL3000]|uniref:WGS project CAEQ00000000 data, annotated contig 153 n=1 Tax=Trypanosoma congolense (strain IL3000) TaxID=1068625 RepID=F9W6V8_TRYCI|nr:unnamed protein product [Trypanosoma congolense IL3000]